VLLALLSAGAAGVHGGVTAEHFREAAIFGAFFAVLGGLQLAWAARILVRPSSPMLACGAVGNALVILTWALSRTVGVPLGPEPGVPETVGFVDAATTALEVGIVVGCVLALCLKTARWLRAPYARGVGIGVSIIAGGLAMLALSAAGRPEGSAEIGAGGAHAAHVVVVLAVAAVAAVVNMFARRIRGSPCSACSGDRAAPRADDTVRARPTGTARASRRLIDDPGHTRVAPSAGWPSG
jgi:hypothetical protein